MMLFSLVAGFVLLVAGGEMVVRGAVAPAWRFEVSPMVIGLTIVGFGTSLPELLVSLNAALTGVPGIAVGNVIGSNLANMMLILGAAALVFPLAVNPGAVRRDGLVMAAFTAVFVIVVLGGSADRYEGAMMLAALAGYVALSLWQDARVSSGTASPRGSGVDDRTTRASLVDDPVCRWRVAVSHCRGGPTGRRSDRVGT